MEVVKTGILYRAGKKEDSPYYTSTSNSSSFGRRNCTHSCRSAIVEKFEQMVLGMALSYASLFHRITDEMQEVFPNDRLEHLRSFYSPWVEHSLFLDALCVEKEFRGKGIGSELMSLRKKKPKKKHYDVWSLIAFNDNTNAQGLYQRHGFDVVQTIELGLMDSSPDKDGCLLMQCGVDQ